MTRLEQMRPRCARCGTSKRRYDFAIRRNGHLASWCRDCHNEHARDMRAKQRETSQFICGNS